LVALNRLGLPRGARAIVNAASDPRGFVKAELNRPNGGLLEVPGLSSTPALATGVCISAGGPASARRRGEIRAPASGTAAIAETKAQGRNLSLDSIAMDVPAKKARCMERNGAPMQQCANEPMQRRPRSPTHQNGRQPLNVIQKPTAPSAGAAATRNDRDCGWWRSVNHFCISATRELAGLGRLVRARGDPPHVLGRFGDMLKAVEQHPAMLLFLDNQQSLGRIRADKTASAADENLARKSWSCIR